jgi:hypothetical protein
MTFQAHISVRRVARTRYPCSTDNVQQHSRPTISVRWHAPAIHAAPTMFNNIPGPQYLCAGTHPLSMQHRQCSTTFQAHNIHVPSGTHLLSMQHRQCSMTFQAHNIRVPSGTHPLSMQHQQCASSQPLCYVAVHTRTCYHTASDDIFQPHNIHAPLSCSIHNIRAPSASIHNICAPSGTHPLSMQHHSSLATYVVH